ncbi:hypothetical protein DAPPUDRAFT_235478 [Daphnia pulex]|uniref:Uncharacterized protein n=1 Tax=Daphnia pulex TaxID=6669 RepID=E9FZ22_DAPPU|nr:hypothetical protein DAPPUDRAFT_235478 [Daphnia pulex]|eukprot:EFX87635.1 hypothetical protein DAPPUDRAFT_235478 [Daphnia pulex]
MASSRLSKTTLIMLGAIIICALVMLASPTDAQQNPGGFDQENKGPIAAALTEDSIITSSSDPAASTFYSNEIIMKILGIVRGSLPNATDNEILIMLSLWIWGFSMLNIILTVLLCCCCHAI